MRRERAPIGRTRSRTGSRPRRALARRRSVPRLATDEAFVALFIGAMEANGHVSGEEAERAHHIMWSMKRFRHRSGVTVGRLIDKMRALLDEYGAVPMVAAAVRAIPARLRPAAFAIASDLVLADGKIERTERQFLRHLADSLSLDPITRDVVLDAMLVKNSA